MVASVPAEPDLERLDAAVDALARDGFTGVAVIAAGGEIAYSRAVGEADPETGAPIDLDTQFDIASITKSVTGMLAAELIASGELDADATLADFFPEAPPELAPITLHQLLTHGAGLRDAVGDDFEALDFDGLRGRAFTSALLHPPGAAYEYSNLGYSLAAGILEQATGRSYEALVIEALDRAGARSTGYMDAIDPARMVRFGDGDSLVDVSWGGHAPGWNLIGNGGMASTARDLIAWRLAYAAGDLVSPEARDLAQTPHRLEGPGAPSHYGYGLVVEDWPGLGRIYWHNGGSRRFSTHWRDFADQDVLIVVLANQHAVSADRMVDTLTRAWFLD
jgi:CubicO group peptidase (beta-lactamase class C family)